MHDVCRWRDCRNQTFGEDEITIISEPAATRRFLLFFLEVSFIFLIFAANNVKSVMSPVFRRESEGSSTSASVLMINAQGIMLSVLGNDYFLSYNRIPWMKDAPISSVLNVQMSGSEAIEWPDLDVDLEIESLRHPERYPLVIKRNPLDYVEA